jgi:hypothetical protein
MLVWPASINWKGPGGAPAGEKGPTTGGHENVWHGDVTWREKPSLGAVLLWKRSALKG